MRPSGRVVGDPRCQPGRAYPKSEPRFKPLEASGAARFGSPSLHKEDPRTEIARPRRYDVRVEEGTRKTDPGDTLAYGLFFPVPRRDLPPPPPPWPAVVLALAYDVITVTPPPGL